MEDLEQGRHLLHADVQAREAHLTGDSYVLRRQELHFIYSYEWIQKLAPLEDTLTGAVSSLVRMRLIRGVLHEA